MECTGQLIYHPQRYRELHPFFPILYKLFRNTCSPEDGCPTTSGMIAMQQRFFSTWNEELDRLPFEDRPENIKRLNEEISIFTHVARCFFGGRNIFHLQQSLTSLLREADVEEIEWRAIRLPYPSFYLWFGKQKDWPLDIAHYVDGAYIETLPGGQGLQITLTSTANVYPDWSKQNFVLDFDPYYFATFDFSPNSNDTVGKALKATLEDDLSFHPEKEQGLAAEDFQQLQEDDIEVRELPPERSGWYEAALEHKANFPVFLQALRLVINGLCFLTAEPGDSVTAFPKEAIELIAGATMDPSKPCTFGAKETKRLHKLGYTEVHFCGNNFVKAAEQHEATGTGGEMSPHRRRAFWRNQACGPGLSERRPKWIRPTIVRKDRLYEGEDAPGHTYFVDPSASDIINLGK